MKGMSKTESMPSKTANSKGNIIKTNITEYMNINLYRKRLSKNSKPTDHAKMEKNGTLKNGTGINDININKEPSTNC